MTHRFAATRIRSRRAITAIIASAAALAIGMGAAFAYYTSQATATGQLTATWAAPTPAAMKWYQVSPVDAPTQCVKVYDPWWALHLVTSACEQTSSFQWGILPTSSEASAPVTLRLKLGYNDTITRTLQIDAQNRPAIGTATPSGTLDKWNITWVTPTQFRLQSVHNGQCLTRNANGSITLAACQPSDNAQLFSAVQSQVTVQTLIPGDIYAGSQTHGYRVVFNFGGFQVGGQTALTQRKEADGTWTTVNVDTKDDQQTSLVVHNWDSQKWPSVPQGQSEWRIIASPSNIELYTGIILNRTGDTITQSGP